MSKSNSGPSSASLVPCPWLLRYLSHLPLGLGPSSLTATLHSLPAPSNDQVQPFSLLAGPRSSSPHLHHASSISCQYESDWLTSHLPDSGLASICPLPAAGLFSVTCKSEFIGPPLTSSSGPHCPCLGELALTYLSHLISPHLPSNPCLQNPLQLH